MSSHIFRIYIPRSLSSFSFWIHRPHHTRKTSLKSASTGTSRSYSCIGSLRAHTMMFLKNMRRPSLFLVLLYAVRADATASVSATLPTNQHADPVDNVDWASFNFGLNGVETEQMWMDRAPVDSYGRASYSTDCLQPTGTLNLSPAATVLNYGQALFEGLKAFRRADGTIAMFRPEKNAARMQQGAKRLLLPPVPTETFLKAADAVVRGNTKWVPPYQKGALYLRPLLMGTGSGLGVKPSVESTFLIYCSPVGNYFKSGLTAIRLQAVRGFSRAAPGGSGSIKASGNYAPAFLVQKQVRERGFDEILCLDALSGQGIEEAGASNFFAIYPNNTIVTPPLNADTILPGVTRQSIIELAEKECGCQVIEGRLTLTDLEEASEAFCCGTGAVITPVGCVSVMDQNGKEEASRITFGDGTTGPLTQKLYKMLTDIQSGSDPVLSEKYQKWIHVVVP